MNSYKVDLYLDGYDSEEEAYEAGFEYIYDALNSSGSSVCVSEIQKTQVVRLTKTQLDELIKYMNSNPETSFVDVSQFTTGIGPATLIQRKTLHGELIEEVDITDYKSW